MITIVNSVTNNQIDLLPSRTIFKRLISISAITGHHLSGEHVDLTDVVPDLTHWGRVTHICVSKLTIIGSDNGLSPSRRQAIIWTNAGILLIRPCGKNFSEILIEIDVFSFEKMHLKMSSAKWRPFCLGLNVLTRDAIVMTPREYYGISDHRQHDCLFNSLFDLTTKTTSKLRIAGLLWENFYSDRIPVTKGKKCWKGFHVMTSSYNLNEAISVKYSSIMILILWGSAHAMGTAM